MSIVKNGLFFVARLNENAVFEVLCEQPNHISEWCWWREVILLNPIESATKARLVIYKNPRTGYALKFVSNMFDYQPSTIKQFYKHR
jgi:hypothetical protein